MAMVSPSAQTRDSVVTPKLSQSVGGTSNQDPDDRGNPANYEALNLIGSGAYGSVYRCTFFSELHFHYSISIEL